MTPQVIKKDVPVDINDVKQEWQKSPRYMSLYSASLANFAATNGAVPDPHKYKDGYVQYMKEFGNYFDNTLIGLYSKDKNIMSVQTDSYIKGADIDLNAKPEKTHRFIQQKYDVSKKYMVSSSQDGVKSIDKYNVSDPLANVKASGGLRFGEQIDGPAPVNIAKATPESLGKQAGQEISEGILEDLSPRLRKRLVADINKYKKVTK